MITRRDLFKLLPMVAATAMIGRNFTASPPVPSIPLRRFFYKAHHGYAIPATAHSVMVAAYTYSELRPSDV